jgi:hypothetical protein
MPDWRPAVNKMPWVEDVPFPTDVDDDPLEPSTPEPPEYGPVPSVILH